MTTDELEKEAERILKYLDEVPMRKDYRLKFLSNALRAVDDVARKEAADYVRMSAKENYAEGFNDAIDRCIEIYRRSGTSEEVERIMIGLKIGEGK